MPATDQHSASQPAGFMSRIGNPLNWSIASRSLLLTCVVTPLTIWYLVIFHYLMANAEVVPYIDREVLAITIRLQTGLVAAWFLLIALLLVMRRYAPDSQWSVHALGALFVWTVAYFAFMIGPFSSMFLPAAFLAGSAASLIILDKTLVSVWLVLLFLIAVGMILLEQMGLIPYAPLLVRAPYQDGHLDRSWLLTVEAVAFFLLPSIGCLLYFLITNWHARERELAQAKEQLVSANAVISRYVPTQVAAGILANDFHTSFRHERRKITVFFSDVKNFTEIADRLEPEEMSRILNEYLSEMTHIADQHGGTLDQYYGDGILIYFGAPTATNDKDHALRAIRMGRDMQARVRQLSAQWQEEILEHPFEIRIGINTGYASVGNYGTQKRMAYMAVGRPVNLAARLQANCEPGRILISHSTWLLVRDTFVCTEKGEIQVKGSHLPVKVYEVGDTAGQARLGQAVKSSD